MDIVEVSKWKNAVKKAKSYLAVGQTSIWLDDKNELPWEFVTRVETGALWRYSTSVSISFEADHKCGLTFKWSIDMEPPSANGTSGFQIDVPYLRGIAAKLPPKIKTEFQKIINVAAEHVEKQAKEYQDSADKINGMALRMRQVTA